MTAKPTSRLARLTSSSRWTTWTARCRCWPTAYNAGPGRPRTWRGQPGNHVLEAAIWAENIPFSETRDYVKKVLSNTTNYAAILTGQPQSLKGRLGLVEPRDASLPEPYTGLALRRRRATQDEWQHGRLECDSASIPAQSQTTAVVQLRQQSGSIGPPTGSTIAAQRC